MNLFAHYTITTCWLLFLIYWIISARRLKPVAERQTRQAAFTYKFPTLLGALLLWWPDACPGLDYQIYDRPIALRLLAAALCMGGLAVAFWARATLADNWSSNVTFKQNHELIQTGPYRWARHPIYTGLLLMALGTALISARLGSWLGLLLMTLGFWIKLKYEEGLMLRHFPDTYPGYQKRVKALVPGLF